MSVVEFPGTQVGMDPRYDPKLSPAMCRAGRAFLNWTQPDLARESGVGIDTINRFETEKSTPQLETLLKFKAALEVAGIEFGEESVAFRPKRRRR